MTEEWREIPTYESLYEASSLGAIRSAEGKTTYTDYHGERHWKQRVLKQYMQPRLYGGYDAKVNLWKDGKARSVLVARCVCAAFHPCEGMEKLTVNHKLGDSTDNRAENLEWVTFAENMHHAWANGLIHRRVPVRLIREDGSRISFASLKDGSEFLGRSACYLAERIAHGRKIARSKTGEEFIIEEVV